jgi:hypothetical protein
VPYLPRTYAGIGFNGGRKSTGGLDLGVGSGRSAGARRAPCRRASEKLRAALDMAGRIADQRQGR